jgi:hypothetical protein
MRPDDSAAAPGHGDDGDGPDQFGLEAAGADTMDRTEGHDVDVIPDDLEPLEDELGERDGYLGGESEFDLDSESLGPDDVDDDDGEEMALLQELGIDLDAPDDPLEGLRLGACLTDDDPIDDGVAA